MTRRCVANALLAGLHGLLFQIQEARDADASIQILVDGVDIVRESDGLHGEPYSDQGWLATFSEHGEPPEES